MNVPVPIVRPTAERYATWFGALSSGTRVQIISLLARHGRPMTVRQIVAEVPVGQSTVSAHLRRLAEVGFVLASRQGTATWYRVNVACIDCFPTAADIVMGRPAPPPPACGAAGERTAACGPDAFASGGFGAAAYSAEDGLPEDALSASLGCGNPAAVASRRPAAPAATSGVAIRPMLPADAGQVLAIYQAGLDSGDASFETAAPGWAHFDRARLPRHRFVATGPGGLVLGWAAVSAVSGRCVYAGVVEDSVYVREDVAGRGVGAALLAALIDSTESAGVWTIQSGIFPENSASLRLHQRAGFRVVGLRRRLGRHHGRWRDVTLLERRSPRAGTD